ncbi:hypothetical protein C8R43DRAFT_1212050 [Mycena crocata]|nr:hypothetical protein C8R43DRAFT_1212050 [Mycena crocata]
MPGLAFHRIPGSHDVGTALAAIATGLNSLANVAQLSGLPHIQPMLFLAIAIVHTLQTFKENKKAFAQLAEDMYSMVQAVVGHQQPFSPELDRQVTDFIAVLENIQIFIQDHQRRGTFFRLFAATDEASRIRDYRRRIRLALDVLQTQMQINIHENIVLLLNERRSAAHPPSYAAAVTDSSDPAIPEELRRIADENFDRLLPILGVVSVFQERPDARQIAGVLGLYETDVRDLWEPISSHIYGLDSAGQTRCLRYLENVVCGRNGTPSIDPSEYHNLVAQWCLTSESQVCASDIFYVSDFWAHHICQSKPSLQLHDALLSSGIPLDPISKDELPNVVLWLEQIRANEEQWASLISTYRQLCGTSQESLVT